MEENGPVESVAQITPEVKVEEKKITKEPKNIRPLVAVLTILVFILVFAFGVKGIYSDQVKDNRNTTTFNITNEDKQFYFNIGVQASMEQLLNQSNDCNIVSVKYYNFTRQLVDVDCVRKLLRDKNVSLS